MQSLLIAERFEQCRSETEVARHKLLRILWAIYACEVKYEVYLFAVMLQSYDTSI